MYEFYEDVPFGVIVLKDNPLEIEYLNNKAKAMFNLDRNIDYNKQYSLRFFEDYRDIILQCYKENGEQILSEIEILNNRFFTVTVKGKKKQVELYLQERTEEVLRTKELMESSRFKLEEEKDKLLSISNELKAQRDIIEILRYREKEHLMHLRDVINNISEGLLVADSKGNFTLCNRAAYKIVELNIGELMNATAVIKKYDFFNTEDNSDDLTGLYEKIFKNHLQIKNFVFKIIDKEKLTQKFIELNSNPIFNKEKEFVYSIITIKDVTEAKRHQILAEEQADFVKDVVNTLDVPIAVIDYPEFTFKLVNEENNSIYKKLTKLNVVPEEFIGKPIKDFMVEGLPKTLFEIIRIVGKKGKEFTTAPYSIKDEDSGERFYKFKFTPYIDNCGKVSRIHIHGLDITEEVNHSLELEKVTRLKDEFFTVISHELRTPLTIIYSSLQLAYKIYSNEITSNVDKTLRRIDQNCSRLLKLINNILDLSKAEAGFLTLNNSSFDIVNITEGIVSSVNLYAKNKGIELVFDTNEEESMVCFDKDKYERILLNLLSNAVKFTPEGKQILVVIEDESKFIKLRVADQGIGIPKDKLDYIFDRFAQVNTSLSRRAEGTGIGLSLVKKLVEYMDGKIEISSEEGSGSEFCVTLNKVCLNSNSPINHETMISNIVDKIDIEFSDIN